MKILALKGLTTDVKIYEIHFAQLTNKIAKSNELRHVQNLKSQIRATINRLFLNTFLYFGDVTNKFLAYKFIYSNAFISASTFHHLWDSTVILSAK